MSGAAAGARPHAGGDGRAGATRARRGGRSTLYEVLQVSPRADEAVIQAAFRVLARTYHPDLNPEPGAHERMRELNRAYRLLSDPRRRTIYDLELNQPSCAHDSPDGIVVRRDTACWRCADPLASGLPRYCAECNWIICGSCRGCGCGQRGRARPLPPLARRARAASGWLAAGLILVAWLASRAVGG